MKVLSVRQPWAYLIVAGYKDIENRKWYTGHRGPLLIHASRAVDPNDFPKQRKWIESAGIVIPEDLPRGAIVGSATLTNVYSDGRDEELQDLMFLRGQDGNPWFEGPYGFEMEYAVQFHQPIPYRGSLGIREASDANMTSDLFETLEDALRFEAFLRRVDTA
jgi:hypothetical protein